MDLSETLNWPFFDDGHRRFAAALARFADATLPALPHDDIDAACGQLVGQVQDRTRRAERWRSSIGQEINVRSVS